MVRILDQLRKTEFSQSHKFLIKFLADSFTYTSKGKTKTVFNPYKDFFPVPDVKEDYFDVSTYDFTALNKIFPVPSDEKTTVLDINFYEKQEHEFGKFIKAWKSFIYPENGRVKTILSPNVLQKVEVMKLDKKNKIVEHNSYDCFLTGKLTFTGTATPSPTIKQITLIIIDEEEKI
jgi:hypothetical protein